MSLFKVIEENDGVEGCLMFIQGLINWQNNCIYKEHLTEEGDFFLSYIQDKEILEVENYIVNEQMYKGLVCNPNDLKEINMSSFTRDEKVAYYFANKGLSDLDKSNSLKKIVIRKYGEGLCLNNLIIDSLIWLLGNRNFVIETYKMEDKNKDAFLKEIESWFYGENEIITSITSEELSNIEILH